MRGLIILAIVLMFFSVSNATILTSGDGGEEWAENLSEEKCREEGVSSVYICNGNVVKVIHSAESEGSTFYKPEGKVIDCPLVPPSEMGAECIQMTMPNFCPSDSICGETDEQTFPGHSDFDEELKKSDEAEDEDQTEEASEDLNAVDENTVADNSQEEGAVEESSENKTEEDDDPSEEEPEERKKPAPGSILDNLALVVLGLAVLSVLVLYLLFRKTIGE